MQNQQAQAATAEVVEGRALARGRPAARDSARRLTARWHQVYALDRLREASYRRQHEAAPGVDGQTGAASGAHLATTLRAVADRLQRGADQAPPVARLSMPQAAGRQRPIGNPTRDNTIVPRAAVAGLTPR